MTALELRQLWRSTYPYGHIDTAPRDHGFRCLLWDQVGEYWVTGEWDSVAVVWITDPIRFSKIQATRWMPLPEKPE